MSCAGSHAPASTRRVRVMRRLEVGELGARLHATTGTLAANPADGRMYLVLVSSISGALQPEPTRYRFACAVYEAKLLYCAHATRTLPASSSATSGYSTEAVAVTSRRTGAIHIGP